jgi:plasmid stabilization system protein ParE
VTYRVIILPRANDDIRRAALWIRERSKTAAIALRWARGIRAKIATLKTNPTRCPVDPDSDAYGEEVRLLLYGKRRGVYRVLFTIQGETVYVLTVRHSAQQRLTDQKDEGEADDENDRYH